MSRFDPSGQDTVAFRYPVAVGSISMFNIVEPISVVSFAGDGVISATIQHRTPK